jgi:AbrB family looped-hinge helix DNA binding protein
MVLVKTRIAAGGRVVIPAQYRRALGLKPGDDVVMALEDGEVRILTADTAVRRAQALVRRYVPQGRDLAEELVRERREEAAGG